jgi:hypothetical protein
MINAAPSKSSTATNLAHPALVLEEYLEDAVRERQLPEPPPTVAIWMIEEFLRKATAEKCRPVDPVASAVSFELADQSYRESQSHLPHNFEVERLREGLATFLDFLLRVENPTSKTLTRPEQREAETLIQFLQALRRRSQSEAYSRVGSCI